VVSAQFGMMTGDAALTDLLLGGCVPVGFDLAGLADADLLDGPGERFPASWAVGAGAGGGNAMDSDAVLGGLVT